jgi:hypothetical protein
MTYLASSLNVSSESPALRSSNRRVATTAVACVLAALAVGTRSLNTMSAPAPAAAHQDVADVRIVDPAFCRDQTWPYIDQRCLKRVAPQQTASTSGNASPPMNIASQTAALPPRDVPPTVASTEQNAPSPIAAAAPAAQSQPPVPAQSSAANPAQTDPTGFPSTTQTAFIDDGTAIKPAPKPHHARHHSGFFFGFRF